MKKIILFIDGLVQGGAQRQLIGLAALLQARGYIVQIVTYHDTSFFKSFLERQGIRYLCIPRPKSIVNLLRLINKAFRDLRPDVVISYLDSPNCIACIVKLFGMKFRLIVSERNTTQRLTVKQRMKFFLYRLADIIVPNSYSQEKFILTHFPNLKKRTQVITNFVDLDTFSPTRKEKEVDRLRIIGAGRIEAQKNIECLIKAAKIVLNQGYTISIDWYGRKTDLVKKYRTAIERDGLEPFFVFHEPTSQIQDKYQEACLFCLPSLYEGYPNVLCEAMACGLPVICSDVCDNASIMEDGKNGYLFNPYDCRELAGRIISFIMLSKEQKILMGVMSRKLAEQKFGKEVFVEKYIKLLQ